MPFVVIRLTLHSAMEPSPEPPCLAVLQQVNDRCLFNRRKCVCMFAVLVRYCLSRSV